MDQTPTTTGQEGPDQAHVTATNIWTAINEALEKHCPDKGPCFKESMRDKMAGSLRLVFSHITAARDAEITLLRSRVQELERQAESGIGRIAAERQRQISYEGWSLEHDDAHKARELARGALAYVEHYVQRAWTYTDELGLIGGAKNGPDVYRGQTMPDCWPWDESWWKPKSPIDDLVKAGALIAAEIDRLQRAETSGANPTWDTQGSMFGGEGGDV